jgi:hypothetical protein
LTAAISKIEIAAVVYSLSAEAGITAGIAGCGQAFRDEAVPNQSLDVRA